MGLAVDLLLEFYECVLPHVCEANSESSTDSSAYWRRLIPDDGRISWTDSSWRVLAKVRASGANYAAFCENVDGDRISFLSYLASDTPGEVIYACKDVCLVTTGDGVAWLKPNRPLNIGEILK